MELQFGKIIEAVESPACHVDWAQELPSQQGPARVAFGGVAKWTAEEEERRTSRLHLRDADLGPKWWKIC